MLALFSKNKKNAMANNEILVTIGVPVYNGAEYLETCLNSLMNQTYKNLEFLITNNGSTDDTREIILNFCKKDPRFKLIDRIKQGAGPARTEQCRLAKGQYICFCDADDYLEKEFVESMLEQNDNCDLVVCDWIKFYENQKKEIRKISLEKDNLDRQDVLDLQKRIFGNNNPKTPMDLDLFSSLCGKLYKVSIINEHNIEIMSSQILGGADDALFNIDYLEFAQSGRKVNKPLYCYFSNPKSFSHNHKISDIEKLNLQYDEFEKRAKKYNKDNSYFVSIMYRMYIQAFSAFLIALNSTEEKRIQKQVVKDYIFSERYQQALKIVTYKSFGFMFKPFFKALKNKHLSFCWFYMKLASSYRNLKNK